MTDSPQTIPELLQKGADNATALSSPGGVPLPYKALRALVSDTVKTLASRGIGAGDRVAIVLDNGPEMAAAFLSIASGATAAPLNPGYRAEEFEFYLTDLRAKLLVVAKDKESPAVEVAKKLNIPIARLAPHPEKGAGSFTLEFAESREPRAAVSREPRAESREPSVQTISPSCFTHQAPRRVPRSFRSRRRTYAPRPATFENLYRSRRKIAGSSSCRCFTSTA